MVFLNDIKTGNIIVELAKFFSSLLRKVVEKQGKLIEDQKEKQVKAIKDNEKQFVNTNVNDYKNEFFFQSKEKYLRKFIIKDLIN